MLAELVYGGFIYLVDLTRNIQNHPSGPLESGRLEHPLPQPHTTQTLAMQQQYRDVPATAIPSMQRRQVHSKQRFVTDLSQRLFEFVIQLLPTQEEMAVKEDVRKLLERLIRTIEPDSRLLSFGSTANGFSLRNSGERVYLSVVEHELRRLPCL
jgi:hypothetical protein